MEPAADRQPTGRPTASGRASRAGDPRDRRRHPIRVLLVDDAVPLRTLLRMMLGRSADVRVVGEAADGPEALAWLANHRAEVVVTDLQMPGMDGVELTARLREQHPHVAVIVHSGYPTDERIQASLAAGADAFVPKATGTLDLVAAVRRVVADRERAVKPTA